MKQIDSVGFSLKSSSGVTISDVISKFLLGPEQQADGHVFHALVITADGAVNAPLGAQLMIWDAATNGPVAKFYPETSVNQLQEHFTVVTGRVFTVVGNG